MNLNLDNEKATKQFSQKLAQCTHNINHAIVIYLEGDLGAGKTTLARGFIQSFGFDRVKSPTYSLVESYQNNDINIHHFDCYRLSDPEELEYIGIRDYLGPSHIQLIEWPALGKGVIAPADLSIELSGVDEQRTLSITIHTP
ncbi:MAG: tRNA (adenosine(37)-N6)-threonylcarbamoyltransferase complex ATPase subunit type 1 TsaE, partial [Gammaproteobacteria bacterium]|nr:tRNA (adenosine(37)-N6)-threonylcarbamoyltransferase complex ATPase subunit type 1 TsaE [Gammaproteobacteria bacterium]